MSEKLMHTSVEQVNKTKMTETKRSEMLNDEELDQVIAGSVEGTSNGKANHPRDEAFIKLFKWIKSWF